MDAALGGGAAGDGGGGGSGSGGGFLAGGDAPTLADFLIVPMLTYLRRTPEGEALTPRFAGVERWYAAMKARPSFAATLPEPPKEAAAE